MKDQLFVKTRLYFTGIVTIAIWSLLIWNHYHGGVPSHHVLAREDLPSISNWWGGILIPLITWFLLSRIQKRIILNNAGKSEPSGFSKNILYGFAGALFFGILLSAFFSLGYTDIPGYMLLGLLLLALFFPIYRAECLLGFVIGMTYTFAPVLPTGIGFILVLIGLVIHLGVRPIIIYITSMIGSLATSNEFKTDRFTKSE
ncbi:hypothetical protein [Daejeonella oryzae]|uniref:hypothetical protein n=1 Tax=Daejeonella oryzae TaxID=1122943 RepID=UPI0003F7A5CD|nr:hypothetical protein [Daejeonella oryzae]